MAKQFRYLGSAVTKKLHWNGTNIRGGERTGWANNWAYICESAPMPTLPAGLARSLALPCLALPCLALPATICLLYCQLLALLARLASSSSFEVHAG